MKRSALLLLVFATTLGACKKSTAVTTPTVVDSLTVAGSWTGCLVEPMVTCSPVSMTLSDSTLTDSTADVTGSGDWGQNVAIKGKLVNANLTLNANATGVLQGWSFAGVLSSDGGTITGNMTTPDDPALYQATFTRSP